MNVDEFKKKFTKELFVKASACGNAREMIALMEKEGLSLENEELDIFVSMMGEKNNRYDGTNDVEWNADCYDRFKMFNDTCEAYKEREYPKIWEGGVSPFADEEEDNKSKEHICMNCEKARSKYAYCFCTK